METLALGSHYVLLMDLTVEPDDMLYDFCRVSRRLYSENSSVTGVVLRRFLSEEGEEVTLLIVV